MVRHRLIGARVVRVKDQIHDNSLSVCLGELCNNDGSWTEIRQDGWVTGMTHGRCTNVGRWAWQREAVRSGTCVKRNVQQAGHATPGNLGPTDWVLARSAEGSRSVAKIINRRCTTCGRWHVLSLSCRHFAISAFSLRAMPGRSAPDARLRSSVEPNPTSTSARAGNGMAIDQGKNS
jgi:hypothetical protein